MGKSVEFWFVIVRPASYLAWTQMPELARETGAEIDYRPFFLPGLFKEAGSSSPISVPAKGKWLLADLKRWANRYGVEFNMNPHFPTSSVYAMRGLIAWRERPEFVALADGFFQSMWVRREDINNPAIVASIVGNAGIDSQEYMAALENPANKQAVFDTTGELAKKGGFGAPHFFVNGEMHWGQDRLDFVREALKNA